MDGWSAIRASIPGRKCLSVMVIHLMAIHKVGYVAALETLARSEWPKRLNWENGATAENSFIVSGTH